MERRSERIVYYDVIRIIACFCILSIHFNASFSAYFGGMFLYPNSVLPNYLFDQSVYLGGFGVSLFFILSGASMFRACGNQGFSLGQFYKKRFLSLYPMFWLAWFTATGVSVLAHGSVAPGGLGAALATVLGMDGYMMALGHTSLSAFYQVGEWYLGCIILIYLVIPLLLWGVKKYPLITAASSLLVFILLYRRVSDEFFLVRIPEVVFGMFFDKYFRPQEGKKRGFWAVGAVVGIVLLSAVGQRFLQAGYSLVLCILISILFYSLVSLIFQNVQDPRWADPVSELAKHTYPAFLIHHQVCEYMAKRFYLPELPKRTLLFSFLLYLVIVAVLSVLLNRTNYVVVNWCKIFSKSSGESESHRTTCDEVLTEGSIERNNCE